MTEVLRPFSSFNFEVRIALGDSSTDPLCQAAFSECSGLEVTVAPKTIREGGNNTQQIHLSGPVSYGQLILKRGMTSSFGLWEWFDRCQRDDERDLRASCEVDMLTSDQKGVVATFVLGGCLPVRLRGPSLTANENGFALEELGVVYETLELRHPPTPPTPPRGGTGA